MTERLMAPLLPDDFRIQSMEDVSPPYWNLGHTTWFFARNVLPRFARAPRGFDGLGDGLEYALNSYYEGLGPRLPRGRRGQVASPSTQTVRDYRAAVDDTVQQLIADADHADLGELERLIAIGCQHEQQHQELFVTEILHIRWSAPEQAAPRLPGGLAIVRHLADTGSGTAAHRRHRRRRQHARLPRPRDCRWRLLLGQRTTGAPRSRQRLRHRRPPDHERRVAAVHRRRRLPGPAAVAVERMGLRAGERAARAALLAARGPRLAALLPLRSARTQPACTRRARVLLRGGCLRALVRCQPRRVAARAPAARERVGARGAQQRLRHRQRQPARRRSRPLRRSMSSPSAPATAPNCDSSPARPGSGPRATMSRTRATARLAAR